MPCIPFRSKDGSVTGVVCTRGSREVHYCSCGRRAGFQCDYPLSGPKQGQLCNRYICDVCKTSIGPDQHYCRVHAQLSKDQGSLPGIRNP